MINILLSLTVLILLLLIGVPVFHAFFGVAIYLVITGGYSISFLFPYSFSQLSAYVILAYPLFILGGKIIEKGGLGEKLINCVNIFFGRIKGGLGIVMVVSCAVFGSISGNATATETVIGSIMIPRMKAAGYDRGRASALIASCCMLGSYIPPSGMLLVYGWLTNTSILACFLSTVVPGIMLIVMFSIWNCIGCAKNRNIQIMPKLPPKEASAYAVKVFKEAIPALLMPIIVLGGIYGGIMTPTEAAAVSIVYSIPVCLFIYKKCTGKQMLAIFKDSAHTTSSIIIMLFCVMMVSRIYVVEDLPSMILNFINSFTQNKWVILTIVNLILIFLGMIMDDTSAMLLSVPILLPIVQSVGISPVQFGAIVVINLGLGCVTPPCAPLLYLGSKVGETPVIEMIKPTFSLILFIWLPMVILVSVFPQLSLWLPNLVLR